MKRVQVRVKASGEWFEKVMKDGKRLMALDLPVKGTVKIAMLRVEHQDYDHFYLRCPVRMIFVHHRDTTFGTYALDVPEEEVERLREEFEEWVAKVDLG